MDDLEWSLDQIGMRQLEVFHEVAETGSFSRAARRLDLRQPTVSNHIKQLEELLGSTLILRESGDVRLTPLGELCHEKLRSVEAAREDFRQALMDHFKAESGTVRVGSSTIPGEVLLPRYLPGFKEEYPDVEVVLEIGDSSRLIRRLRDGDLRFGVIGTETADDELEFKPLFRDEMVLVGREKYQRTDPVTLDKLSEFPYVDRLPGSGTRQAVEQFIRDRGHDPDDVLDRTAQVETVQALREAVFNGLGVAFLPGCMLDSSALNGEVGTINCDFDTLERTFYRVSHRTLGLPPLLESLESHLVSKTGVES